MAGLAVSLVGCADNEIRQLEAQPSDEEAPEMAEMDAATPDSPAAANFTPEDTASRTVREAIDQQVESWRHARTTTSEEPSAIPAPGPVDLPHSQESAAPRAA